MADEAQLNRDLGRTEGELGIVTKLLIDFGNRLTALEKRVYWMCGASAAGGALLSKVEIGALLSTVARAAGL